MGKWLYNIALHLPETQEEKRRRFIQWYSFSDENVDDMVLNRIQRIAKKYKIDFVKLLMLWDEYMLRCMIKGKYVEDIVGYMKTLYPQYVNMERVII